MYSMLFSSQGEDKFFVLEESLKAMLLCHNTQTKFNSKNPQELVHETQNRHHAAALEFCRDLGFAFEGNLKINSAMIPVYKVKSSDYNEFYPILSINEYSTKRNRFSILVNEKYSSMSKSEDLKATLYVWSLDFNTIINNLELSESVKEKIKETTQKLREQGFQIMFYCKRELSIEEKNDFLVRKEQKQATLERDGDLEELYNEFETRLDFLSGVYFDYELRPSVIECIRGLKEAKLKLFLLSEDDEDKTFSVAYKTQLINEHSKIKKLVATDQESLTTMIKHILNSLKKDLFHEKPLIHDHQRVRKEASIKKGADATKSHEKFILSFDGPTLSLILRSKSSTSNFKFLLTFSSNVIGFNMTPVFKKELLQMIRQLHHDRFDIRALAIANTPADAPLLQLADVGVIVGERTISIPGADIILESFSELATLVIVISRLSSDLIENMLHWFGFAGSFFLFLRFSTEFFTLFSNAEIVPALFLILIFKNMLILSIISFCFLKDKKNRLLLQTLPLLYMRKPLSQSIQQKAFLYRAIVPAAAATLLVYTFVTSREFDKRSTRTIDEYQIEIFMCMSMIVYLQV